MTALFTHTQRHPAAARPAKAQGNVFEIPFVAALLIVDDQVAVLQTDFVEVLAVEPGQAQAVEPIEAGEQSAGLTVIRGLGRRARCGALRWRGSRAPKSGCGGLTLRSAGWLFF